MYGTGIQTHESMNRIKSPEKKSMPMQSTNIWESQEYSMKRVSSVNDVGITGYSVNGVGIIGYSHVK